MHIRRRSSLAVHWTHTKKHRGACRYSRATDAPICASDPGQDRGRRRPSKLDCAGYAKRPGARPWMALSESSPSIQLSTASFETKHWTPRLRVLAPLQCLCGCPCGSDTGSRIGVRNPHQNRVPKRLSDGLDAGCSISHEDDVNDVRICFEEAKDTCTDILYSVGGEF